MDQIIQSQAVNVSARSAEAIAVKSNDTAMTAIWQRAELGRFGFTPVILLIVISIAAIAGAAVLQESSFKLALVTLPAAVVEAMIIAVLPMRTIVLTSILSVIISLIVALV
jgi:hypothetical protein